MNLISFSTQVSIILGEKSHRRFSRIITFGPFSFSLDFKNIRKKKLFESFHIKPSKGSRIINRKTERTFWDPSHSPFVLIFCLVKYSLNSQTAFSLNITDTDCYCFECSVQFLQALSAQCSFFVRIISNICFATVQDVCFRNSF